MPAWQLLFRRIENFYGGNEFSLHNLQVELRDEFTRRYPNHSNIDNKIARTLWTLINKHLVQKNQSGNYQLIQPQ